MISKEMHARYLDMVGYYAERKKKPFSVANRLIARNSNIFSNSVINDNVQGDIMSDRVALTVLYCAESYPQLGTYAKGEECQYEK